MGHPRVLANMGTAKKTNKGLSQLSSLRERNRLLWTEAVGGAFKMGSPGAFPDLKSENLWPRGEGAGRGKAGHVPESQEASRLED